MNIPQSILEQAQDNDIVLYLKGSQLAYVSEEGGFPEDLKGLIRQHKDSIVAHLLQLQAQERQQNDASLITVVDKDQLLPLSFAQQGLWFVDKLEGGSSQYNIPAAFRVSGHLNLASMRMALDSLVERHEVLRTIFVEQDGEVYQRIRPVDELDLPVIDLGSYDDEKQQEMVKQLVDEEMNKRFDLSADLMLRVKVLKLSSVKHVMLFTMHHIVSDGWSQAILVREFVSLYDSYCRHQPNPLSPLEVQYGDYAHWQRSYYSDEILSEQFAFWQQRLAGAPKRHSLPLDFARRPQQRFVGQTHNWMVDLDLLNRVKVMAKDHDATLFMVLYTVYSVVIGRWSQSRDVVIGSPIAGRTHPQVAPLIGYFINSIVYRSQWSEEQSFTSLLSENRGYTLAAYDHQNIPLESLVDKLKISRELSHSPLFQLMFTMQNNEKSDLQLPGLTIDVLGGENAIIKYDMEMEATEQDNGIQFHWNYSTCLFDESSVKTMAASFNMVLEQIAENPELLVEQIKLLPQTAPRLALLPASETVHSLFEQMAVKRGDDIAITSQLTQISYRKLNARANQLARHLLTKGMSTGQTVLVCLSNTDSCYVALLAVLKAGGQYCYYEPSHCEEFLADAQNRIVISESTLCDKMPDTAIMADDEALLSTYADDNITPEQVMVNGNTGAIGDSLRGNQRITHTTVCNQIARQQQQMALSEQSSIMILPDSGYFAATEWLGALVSGAKLVLVENHEQTASVLTAQKVTHITLTPTLLKELLCREGYQLEHIAVAGASSCQNLLWQWAEYYRVTSVLNISVSCYICYEEVKAGMEFNLGKMSQHCGAKILHQGMQQTPAGVIGDLYLDNIIISDGKSGYYSGLKVRQLADQSIQIISDETQGLGRDQQLVELIIGSQPLVSQVAISDAMVFVCLSPECRDTQLALDELQQHLKQVLPLYMLPEHYMAVAQMPLSATAQIDRNLLSLQTSHWQTVLKVCPEVTCLSTDPQSPDIREEVPFALTEEASKALSVLADQHGISLPMALSAVFTIALSVHNDLGLVASTVIGLTTTDAVNRSSVAFTISQLDETSSTADLIRKMVGSLREALRYRFVNQQWLTENYNRLHHARVSNLFDYQLCFGGEVGTGNCAVALQIDGISSTKVDGQWYFDRNRFRNTEIIRLTSSLNLFLPWIEQQQALTPAAIKQRLKEEIRSKVQSAKRKFKPGFNKK